MRELSGAGSEADPEILRLMTPTPAEVASVLAGHSRAKSQAGKEITRGLKLQLDQLALIRGLLQEIVGMLRKDQP